MKKLRIFYLMLPLLVLLITQLLIPVSAESADVPQSEDIFWSFDPNTATLTISGNGALPDFFHSTTVSEIPWIYLRDTIQSVVVSPGITHIGDYSFYKLTALTDVELPNTLKSIGEYAFSNCTSLKNITIPNGVTHIKTAFYGSTALESIVLPDSVTELGGACFSGCSNLKKVTLSKSLTKIESSTFYECDNLQEIVLPEGISYIGQSAFSGCSSLPAITIPKSTTYIGMDAFEGNTKLREVTVLGAPEFSSSVFESNGNSIELMKFCGDMPAFNGGSMTHVYADCYYPKGNATWNNLNNNNYDGTLVWHAVDDPSQIQLGNSMSGSCGTNTTWELKDGVMTISGNGTMDYYRWHNYKDDITTLIIEEGVTSIANEAFHGCDNLKTVVLPDSMTELGAPFWGCRSLSSITLPKTITRINRLAFKDCTALKEIVIPEGVTYIAEDAFRNSGLEKITLPDSLTTIGKYAFYDCKNLKQLHFPANLTFIGDYALSGCPNLKSLYFYGDPPLTDTFTFRGLRATAYYPPGNELWETKGLAVFNASVKEVPNLPSNSANTNPATDPSTNPTTNQTPDPTTPAAPDATVNTTPGATVDTSPGATVDTTPDATTPSGTAPSGQDSTTKPAPGLPPTEPTSPNTPAKTGWVLPVVVLVGILGCGAVIWYVLYKRNKETPSSA